MPRDKAVILWTVTHHFVKAGWIIPRDLEKLVGCRLLELAFDVQPRGPLHHEPSLPRHPRPPEFQEDPDSWSPQARAGGALRLGATVRRQPRGSVAPKAFAMDSSDTGFGVTVTAATVSELREEARYCELRGWTVALEDSYAEIEESIWADGADQNVQDLAESATPGPAPWPRSRRSFRVLHLFPGFRRKEDVEWWIRIRTLAEGMGLIVDVFSVDVAVDGSMDVTQEKIRLGLLEDVRQGFYHASIKGPPCTTWSRARFNQKKGGLRPLCTRSEPWGRPDSLMTEGEPKKVNLGTQLLNVSLDMFEEIAKVDGVFILEHPQDPIQELHPTHPPSTSPGSAAWRRSPKSTPSTSNNASSACPRARRPRSWPWESPTAGYGRRRRPSWDGVATTRCTS